MKTTSPALWSILLLALLVLGGCYPGQEAAFLQHKLIPALLDAETSLRLDAAARRQVVHSAVKK